MSNNSSDNESQEGTGGDNFADAASTAASVPFALNPSQATGNDLLDFNKKLHKTHYQAATKSLCSDATERFDLTEDKLHDFLAALKQRADDCALSTIDVPTDLSDLAGSPTKNLCTSHGEIKLSHLKAFCSSFVGQQTRAAQDDYMLYMALVNSVSVQAFSDLSNLAEEFTINGSKSGALFLWTIVYESEGTASYDPDLIRTQLSQAASKFQQLQQSVKEFNNWVNLKLKQLKATGLDSDEFVRPHLMEAYRTSDDKEFCAYINSIKDTIRDGRESYTPRQIMSMAKKKEDDIHLAKQVTSAKGPMSGKDEQILALQAQVASLQKRFGASGKTTTNKRSSVGGHSGGKFSGGNKLKGKGIPNNKGHQSKPPPFPSELRTAPAPANPDAPRVIDGVQYWWCKLHKKWGKHPTSDCRKAASQNAQGDSHPSAASGGDRQSRYIRAVSALVTNNQE